VSQLGKPPSGGCCRAESDRFSEQPVDDDVRAVADLEPEINGLVEMKSQFGMHRFNRFDGTGDCFADGLPRTFGVELLANASTETLGRFDLIQNGLAFFAKLLTIETGISLGMP
jgi:hypothetical protein